MSPPWAPRVDEKHPLHNNLGVSKHLTGSNATLLRPPEFEMYPVWGATLASSGPNASFSLTPSSASGGPAPQASLGLWVPATADRSDYGRLEGVVASPGEVPGSRTLHSWKKIASHLGVTVRSAQRWEKIGDLPVRRAGSGRSARVLAFTDELEAWLASGGAERGAKKAETAGDSEAGKTGVLPHTADQVVGGLMGTMPFFVLLLGHAKSFHEGVVLLRAWSTGRPLLGRSLTRFWASASRRGRLPGGCDPRGRRGV